MRVALVCPYDWDAPGGVQVQVRQLGARLVQRGHQVLVLAPGRSTPVDPVEGETAGPTVRIVARPVAIRYQGTVAPIAPWPWSARPIGRALRGFRPDIVHAHEPLTPSTSMVAVLRAPGPVVATFHAYAERSRMFDVAAPVLRPVWRRLTVRMAVSEAAAAFVERRMGDDIRIVPNGVEVQEFAAGEPASGLPEGRRMLWVGRLDRQKGFPVAVRAFGRLAPEFPDLRFVVVGDGRDRDAVKLLSGPLRARVAMVGTVPHQRLPAYHAGAAVAVSPALSQETFGLVLVEAMAAGVPIVATDIPGYREVVRTEEDGLLVPPGDPGALAGAVRRVLVDPALAGRLRDGGRARAEHYRWDRVVELVEGAYAAALSTGRPEGR